MLRTAFVLLLIFAAPAGAQTIAAPAPGLAVGGGTCEGSMTGGLATGVFGFSFGATRERSNCDRRADAMALAAIGEREAAAELLCQKPEVREARREAGRPCRADAQVAQAPAPRAGELAVRPIDVCSTLSSAAERRAYAKACGR